LLYTVSDGRLADYYSIRKTNMSFVYDTYIRKKSEQLNQLYSLIHSLKADE